MRLALTLLAEPALDALITGESEFDALPEVMAATVSVACRHAVPSDKVFVNGVVQGATCSVQGCWVQRCNRWVKGADRCVKGAEGRVPVQGAEGQV